MKLRYSILTVAAAVIAIGQLSNTAQAQGRHGHHSGGQNVARQAQTVDQLANQLRGEFRAHYSKSPQYRHLSADAAALSSRAKTIQGLARHRAPSASQLDREVRELDRLNQHIKGLVRETQRGRHGASRHNHVQQVLRSLDSSISRLRNEVATLNRGHHHGGRHASGRDHGRGPVAPPRHERGGRR